MLSKTVKQSVKMMSKQKKKNNHRREKNLLAHKLCTYTEQNSLKLSFQR